MYTLVTGGTGLVGFNIIKVLLSEGRRVKALVRSLEKAERILPKEVLCVKGDITEKESIRNAMEDCSVIYHAAGFPEQWMKDDSIFEKVNVMGTQNMVDVALEFNVDKFVYTSTIDVFEAGQGQNYNESIIDPHDKGTYYERSKQEADRRVVAAMDKGLRAVFLHPSGVYGPGPTDSPGTNHFINDLINNEIPVLLPGGYPIVFSEDVGKGHFLAEQHAPIGSRYILSESYHSLYDFASLILESANLSRTPPKVMPYFIGKMISVVTEFWANLSGNPPLVPKGQLTFLQWQAQPSSDKAQKELGWKPTFAKEGMIKTLHYLGLS